MAHRLPEIFRTHLRPWILRISFISWHYTYFCVTCLLASLTFWGSSTPERSVSYIDSLFLCISAMTEAGLNTINLSTLNTWQQVMLFLLIIFGSSIFVSIAILHIRKRAFEQKFAELVKRRRSRLQRSRTLTFSWSKRRRSLSNDRENAIASGAVRGRPIHDSTPDTEDKASFASWKRGGSQSVEGTEITQVASGGHDPDSMDLNGHIRFEDHLPALGHHESPSRALRRHRTTFFEGRGVGARGLENHPRNSRPQDHSDDEDEDDRVTEENIGPSEGAQSKLDKYLDTVNGYLGRNSQFFHLNEKERRKLGGIEYDALCLLSWVIPLYFFLFQLLGALSVGAWMRVNRPGTTLKNGLDPFWTGAFFAISAFNNSGMALLDANATVLQTSYFVLLTLSLLILAGNTCFPPFLRLVLWTMKQMIRNGSTSPEWQRRRRTLGFCLDHPRRVYTNLFPSTQTWWLVLSLFILNGIDWLAFELLNIGNPTTDVIPTHFRVLDGLFQAFAVRSGGFYVVNIAGLRSGLLVLYVLMMYINVYPLTLTIRNTNVYEERSLGIYAEDLKESPDTTHDEKAARPPRKLLSGLKRTMTMTMTHGQPEASALKDSTWTRQDFIRQQLRGQLGHDLWGLGLAVFVITAIETGQFERDPVVFSTFNIIFEVVSGYGCVGISTGVPNNAYSFSGAWHTASKLVLCAVMLRGRHRGLPVSIDRAILLPDESLAWAEEEDAHKRSASLGATGFSAMAMASREGLRRPRTASFGMPGPSVNGAGGDHDGDVSHIV